MNNKQYDILKWAAQYFLPALGTLYFALSAIWGLPFGEEVVGTIVALTAFLGVILGISNHQYDKEDNTDGTMFIDTTDVTKDLYNLELSTDLDDLRDKSTMILKINKSQDKHTL